jgi:prepilin-type processing-associated H-X9-DG protein
MQYRLSTLFLVFFLVAASLAVFGSFGLWISSIILLVALILNKTKILKTGIKWSVQLIFIGIICPGLLTPALTHRSSVVKEASQIACLLDLTQIGFALNNYQDTYKHFPPANTCDKNGKPLFSWRVEILPMMESGPISNLQCGPIYNSLKKDEPWNSQINASLLDTVTSPYLCPSGSNVYSTNYVAVIGPGTAWRKDGPVNLSDLPDGGSHTVMVVEVANSGVPWAEPRDLTVEEALENMRTGKGLRISSPHPNVINVLFADGKVRPLPLKMPISMWQKILGGEMKVLDNLNIIDESAPDMVDVSVNPHPYTPGKWVIILCTVVWLLSVILLFRRAIQSRRKLDTATQNPQMTQINADKVS